MSYESIQAVRWSHLKHMRTSPLHYRHAVEAPSRDTPAMRIGRAAHALVLEPDGFRDHFVCYEGQRRGKAWDEFAAEHAGKEILTRAEYDKAVGAGTAVLAHPVASQYLARGMREATLTWEDEQTGLRCKGKVDHAGGYLVDLKLTSAIEPTRFYSHAARMGYHGQCAWYQWGLTENEIEVAEEPVIIAAEMEQPFDVAVYLLPDYVVAEGHRLYRTLLDRVAECLRLDEWPGVAPGEVHLSLPDWAFSDDDDSEPLTMGGVVIGGL